MKKFFALLLAAVLCFSAVVTATAEGSDEVVFNLCVYFEETWWDPAFFTQANDTGLGCMIYENLVELQTDGTVKPQLAESWTISDDGLTYTFNLRKGVQWHKGYGEFTSADVKFTIERLGDETLGSVSGSYLGIDNIEAIECPDDYTVVIKLKNIDVDLLTKLGQFYGMIVCKAHNDQDGTASLNTDPIGTGPFVFDGGTLAKKTEAVANEQWWGDREGGNIDRIVCTLIDETNTYYNAFENGELDAIYCLDYEKADEFGSKGYTVQTIPMRQLLYAGVNMSMAPFDNEKVREAFYHAIDPSYIIEYLYFNRETVPGSYIPSGSKYALADGFTSAYDPELSKQLLAEAGYPDGLEIDLWSVDDAKGAPPTMLVYDMLEKAGFKVNLQMGEFGSFIGAVRAGTAQTWCLLNSTGILADDTIIRYTSQYYPGNNWSGVCDEEYDALVAAGQNATTEQEKYDNFYKAQQRLLSLNAVIPISTYSQSMIFQSNITGLKVYGDLTFRATTVIK